MLTKKFPLEFKKFWQSAIHFLLVITKKTVHSKESLCEIAIKNSKPPETESTYKEGRNERAKLSEFAAKEKLE